MIGIFKHALMITTFVLFMMLLIPGFISFYVNNFNATKVPGDI